MSVYAFGRVSFGPQVQDGVSRVATGPLLSGERHIPYSDFNVIDVGGRGARRYKAKIKIPPDQVVYLEALLGQIDVLTVDDAVFGQAILLSLGEPQMTPRREFVWYDAEWAIVTAGSVPRGPI